MVRNAESSWAVYFLLPTDRGYFKIGLTDDTARRARNVEPSADRKRSWAVYFPHKALARDCETALKRQFAHARYSGDKTLEGHSERFLVAVFDEAGRWVRANKKKLGWTRQVRGERIFAPHRVSLPIWVTEETRHALKLAAIKNRTTVNQIVRDLIDDWDQRQDARTTGD